VIITVSAPRRGFEGNNLAIAITCGLLSLGKTVLIIDADPKQASTSWRGKAHEQGRAVPEVKLSPPLMKLDSALLKYGKEFEFVLVDIPADTDKDTRKAYFERSDLVLCSVEGDTQSEAKSEAHATVTLVRESRSVRPKLRHWIMVMCRGADDWGGRAVSFSAFVDKLVTARTVVLNPKSLEGPVPVHVDPDEIRNLIGPKAVVADHKTEKTKVAPQVPRQQDGTQDLTEPSSKVRGVVARKRSGKQVRQFTVYLPPEVLKEARKAALDEDLKVSEIMVKALQSYLAGR
jgi:hypothetical protein